MPIGRKRNNRGGEMDRLAFMQHNFNTGGGRDEVNNSVNARCFSAIFVRAANLPLQKRIPSRLMVTAGFAALKMSGGRNK